MFDSSSPHPILTNHDGARFVRDDDGSLYLVEEVGVTRVGGFSVIALHPCTGSLLPHVGRLTETDQTTRLVIV